MSFAVVISATKGGVTFKSTGELGSGQTTLKPYSDAEKEEDEVRCMTRRALATSLLASQSHCWPALGLEAVP